MNSHMKTWLNSLNLNWSGFSFNLKSVFSKRTNFTHPKKYLPLLRLFSLSLPALRLCCCCCSRATGLHGSYGRRWVLLLTADWGGLEGHALAMMMSRSTWPACQQWRKRNLQVERDKDTIQAEQLDLQKAFNRTQKKADGSTSNARHNANVAQLMMWEFTWDSWRMLPPCCWLQHYANTDTSKVQVTIQEAQGVQSYQKKSRVERNVVRWNRRLDWKALAWFYRQPELNGFEHQKLKNSDVILSSYAGNLTTNNLSCQMILNGSRCIPLIIPAILLCVQCSTLLKGERSCWHFFNLIIWTWSSPLFHCISNFKLQVGNWSESLSLTTTDSEWRTEVM